MEHLQNLLANTQYSALTALILGLMTAISPCPMATNITAIGYMSRHLENPQRVFVSGLVYTLGRAVSYTLLAVILFLGADQLNVSMLFQGWGEKLLGPLLIIIGVLMLDFIPLPFPTWRAMTEKVGNHKNHWGSFALGMIFAMAFCPYSGVLYFMMLMPITLQSAGGLYLPMIFAIATAVPVIVFAWLLAFSINSVNRWYTRIKNFETWFRRVVAVLFIATGVYYIAVFFI